MVFTFLAENLAFFNLSRREGLPAAFADFYSNGYWFIHIYVFICYGRHYCLPI